MLINSDQKKKNARTRTFPNLTSVNLLKNIEKTYSKIMLGIAQNVSK